MNVSTLIFLGLAVVWAIVLLPEVLRKISGSRQSDTIGSFNHQLSVLNRSEQRSSGRSNVIDLGARAAARRTIDLRDGATSAPRPVPMAVRKRRQEVLTVLGSASLLSLVCTVAFGGPFLLLLVVTGGLFVTYVVMLAQVHAERSGPQPHGSVAGVSVAVARRPAHRDGRPGDPVERPPHRELIARDRSAVGIAWSPDSGTTITPAKTAGSFRGCSSVG